MHTAWAGWRGVALGLLATGAGTAACGEAPAGDAGANTGERGAEVRGGVPAYGGVGFVTPDFARAIVNIGFGVDGNMANNTCTGTLITPRHVLTAAHCEITTEMGVASASSVAGYNPGAPAQWSAGVAAFTSLGRFKPTQGKSPNPTRSFDLQIATLHRAIEPFEALPVPVWYGGSAAVSAYKASRFVFGYGKNHTGQLRFGLIDDLKHYHEPCNWYEVLGSCYEASLWESLSSTEVLKPENSGNYLTAKTDNGDSGGPLLFNVPGFGWSVVGVLSGNYGYETDIGDFFYSRYSYHAQTGSGPGHDNGAWIRAVIGAEDLDQDGIPDAADNCPLSRCIANKIDPARCKTTDQTDLDHDGVGDACDNCAPTTATGVPQCCVGADCTADVDACGNKDQKNSDLDAAGDACDACPRSTNQPPGSVPGDDLDGDKIPNACDLCPSSPLPRVACVAGTGADPTPTCADGSTCIRALGVCDTQPDADGDGLGNACDLCGSGWKRKSEGENSNVLAEEREAATRPPGAVKTLPDICDPVPVARLSPVKATPLNHAFTQGDGEDADDVAELEITTTRGRVAETSPRVAFTNPVEFSFCPCVNAAGEPTRDDDCLGRGERCDVPAMGFTGWSQPLEVVASATGGPSPAAAPFDTQANQKFYFDWNWHKDVVAGKITHTLAPETLIATPITRLHGAVFSRVRKVGPNVSPGRDAAFSLRDHAALVETGFTLYGGKYSPIPRPLKVNPWRDREYAYPGPDPIDELLRTFRHPKLVQDLDSLPLLDVEGSWLELDTYWSGYDIEQLRGKTWLPAVESAFARRAAGVSTQAALVGRDAITPFVTRVGVVVPTEAGISVRYARGATEGSGRVAAGLAAPLATPTPSVPPPVPVPDGPPTDPFSESPTPRYPERTGFAAAYAATLGALVVAGGTEDGSPAAAPHFLHWIADNQWVELPPVVGQDQPSRTLSVGIDAERRLAYVLDLVKLKGLFKGLTIARLTRHSLDGAAPKVLFELPWTGKLRGAHLTVLEDGLLAITTVRSDAWATFRLDGTGSVLRWRGKVGGQGRVVDGPVMAEHDALLPVVVGEELLYVSLDAGRFLGQEPCSL